MKPTREAHAEKLRARQKLFGAAKPKRGHGPGRPVGIKVDDKKWERRRRGYLLKAGRRDRAEAEGLL